MVVRNRELQAHQAGKDAREDEEAECRDDVALPDRLVVGDAEPADDAARDVPCLRELAAQALFISRRDRDAALDGMHEPAHRRLRTYASTA